MSKHGKSHLWRRIACGHAYEWRRVLYRVVVVMLRWVSGGTCQLAIAELLTAPVVQLRRLERLPKSLQVQLASERDLPQLQRFVSAADRVITRLAEGDSCVIALCQEQVLATEWFKVGPAVYREDLASLGVEFSIPPRTCWLYDGVSGEDGQALGPWGAVMGRLRSYLEAQEVDSVCFQVGFENRYSLACHEALGFHVVGRLCCLRLGHYRLRLWKTPHGAWRRLHNPIFDLCQLRIDSRFDTAALLAHREQL